MNKENRSSVATEEEDTASSPKFKQEFVEEAVHDSIRWIIWYLRRLVQADEVFNKELTKKYQVSQPQLTCLLALFEYGPLPVSKLAKYVLVKPSTATGIVDRLEEKGLVKRERSVLDRRIVTIHLTKSGNEVSKKAPLPIPTPLVEGLNKLPVKETRKIVESLAMLVAMLDDATA